MSISMHDPKKQVPAWLANPERYVPVKGSNRYVRRSILSVAGVLEQFRLDDGRDSWFSPSAPAKLILALGGIVFTSLSRNFMFVIFMLAIMLTRIAVLPAPALKRVVVVAFGAAVLTFLLMLPAVFVGQPHAAVLLSGKVLVSTSIALTVAATTPYNELTAGLRTLHVPALFVQLIDLALKNIVSLGRTASEVLESLSLRSVGSTEGKGRALGGVGGTVFLKSNAAAEAVFDSMTCRCFDGEYRFTHNRAWRRIDVAWFVGFVALVGVFAYLQHVV